MASRSRPTSKTQLDVDLASNQAINAMELAKRSCKMIRILVCGEFKIGKSTLIRRVFPVGFKSNTDRNLLDGYDTEARGRRLEMEAKALESFEPGDISEMLYNLNSRGRQAEEDINLNFADGSQPEPTLWIYEYNCPRGSPFDVSEELADFITQHTSPNLSCGERLHFIWYCIKAPTAENSLASGVEKVIQLSSACRVPIVFIFTQYDNLVKAKIQKDNRNRSPFVEYRDVEKKARSETAALLKDFCSPVFEKAKAHGILCTYVSVKDEFEYTLNTLMDTTLDTLFVPQPLNSFWRGPGHPWYKVGNQCKAEAMGLSSKEMGALGILLASAQHVNTEAKLRYCIVMGNMGNYFLNSRVTLMSISLFDQGYWQGLGPGIRFVGKNIRECLFLIHEEIIQFWNMNEVNEPFLGTSNYMEVILGLVSELAFPRQSGPGVDLSKPVLITKKWADQVYNPETLPLGCIMAYVVGLVTILYMITEKHNVVDKTGALGGMTRYKLEKCSDIHTEIRSYVAKHRKAPLYSSDMKRDKVLEKINDLIIKYTVGYN